MSQRGKTPSGHPLVNSQKIVRPELHLDEHLDESTSHIHIYLIPLDEREIKGSRSKLLTSENQKMPESNTTNRKENQKSSNYRLKIDDFRFTPSIRKELSDWRLPIEDRDYSIEQLRDYLLPPQKEPVRINLQS